MTLLLAAAAIIGTTYSSGDTSDHFAMHQAHLIGEYAGYRSGKGRVIDYDLVDNPSHRTYPGFVTIELLTNGHAAFHLSIDKRSGRAFDFINCFVFEYPVLHHRSRQSATDDMKRRLYEKIMATNGCDRYSILRRRGDDARHLVVHRVPL
jgi:hypothetical protein